MHPLLHYVHITQFPESAKQELARFFHFLPGMIGINGGDPVSHRTAAAKGHAQIMYRIGSEGYACPVALFEHALHPESQTVFLLDGFYNHGCGGHIVSSVFTRADKATQKLCVHTGLKPCSSQVS